MILNPQMNQQEIDRFTERRLYEDGRLDTKIQCILDGDPAGTPAQLIENAAIF